MRFCDKLKEARKKAGLTQAELAKKLNVSQSTIGNWEADIREPDIESIKKIASVLCVQVIDLIDVRPPIPSNQWDELQTLLMDLMPSLLDAQYILKIAKKIAGYYDDDKNTKPEATTNSIHTAEDIKR